MKKLLKLLLKTFAWGTALVLVAGVAALVVANRYYQQYRMRAEAYDLSQITEVPQRSAVYDVNGELYSYLHGQNRIIVPLHSVSGWFIQALLAREDSRFWEHHGIDYQGIARAVWTNYRSHGVRQGASTLTQQLAKQSFELTGKTYDRKGVEALLAQRIERNFTKEQILEHYVNRVYFGSGFYGIEAAARGYFGKPASELTLGESAMLAGLIRSPNKFSPARNMDASMGERNTVLDRMVDEQMITQEQAAAAKAARIALSPQRGLRFEDDYVMDAVNRQLEEILDRNLVERGGLRIYTTIDPQLQQFAQEAADRQLTTIEQGKKYPHPRKADYKPGDDPEQEKPTEYIQAGVVAIDNRTGAIRAIVGGRDFKQSRYNRALISLRQIGSTFKPFVYASAFQRGMLPGTLVDDSKIAPGEFQNISHNWSPENSDGEYEGMQPASFGLIKSRNTMSVRIGEYVGLPTVRQVANNLGIGSRMPDYPVSFLGAFETSLKDITAAYTVFPNNGVMRSPYLIARVEDTKGGVVYETDQAEKRIFSPDTSWMITSILQQVMKSGTAAKAAQMGWKKPGAGKTGTTNDFKDAWFVGYTSSLTCGVWVGMDKPQTIMEKGYGGALALPIWVDFMQRVPERTYPAKPFDAPVQLVKVHLCGASGARATSSCDQLHTAYDAELPATRVPNHVCPVHPEPQPAAPVYTYTPPSYSPYVTPNGTRPAMSSVAPLAPTATTPVTPRSPQSIAQANPGGESSVGSAPPAPAPVQRPSTTIDFNSPTTTIRRDSDPGPRMRVERTPYGMRIVREVPAEPQERITAAPRPAPQPRVLRAIPVHPDERERIAAEQIERVPAPRVYRGEPILRERSTGRIIRIVPRGDEEVY